MLCSDDTQVTSCCVEMIHDLQHLVRIWHAINKKLLGYDTPLTRCCLDMTHH